MAAHRSVPSFRLKPLALVMLGLLPLVAQAESCAGINIPSVSQAGLTDLGTLGGSILPIVERANAVSASGTVVVGQALNANCSSRAFRWTSSGGVVDLGMLPGGEFSEAYGVSADGTVVVGVSEDGFTRPDHAVRWSSSGSILDLGTLGGGPSVAYATSENGTIVVGGAQTTGNAGMHAFRWVEGATGGVVDNRQMYDLGTLGGANSVAKGVSADGTVVVGDSGTATANRAFRWVQGATGGVSDNKQMYDLGTLGGASSFAAGVSADGAVVVGTADISATASTPIPSAPSGSSGPIAPNPYFKPTHAFRWTTAGGMKDLGTLGGTSSYAYGVSANGKVVVGSSGIAISDSNVEKMSKGSSSRAFRWTEASGMQSVEDWLRASGVTVSADVATYSANGTNRDGSVVVGELGSGTAFIARSTSGLITLDDVQDSLGAASVGGGMALRSAGTLINGAHSDPLMRRVEAGKNNFWLAGDWGRDDHGARDGDLGLAEIGFGRNFGPVQVNVSAGQTWARQNLTLNGHAETDGAYLLTEALLPLGANLWGTLGAYTYHGEADLRRGYLNAGVQDSSSASPTVNTLGLRARLDWDKAVQAAGADFSPYADLSYAVSKLAAYTETGGGFPARFDSRQDKATELRLGVNASRPLDNGMNLVGTLEAAHRFEKNSDRTSGELLGLFSFNLDGQKNKQDWLRARVGVEGKLAGGIASLSVNATTQGETPSAWLAANWQMAF